ncbi:Rho GTPase activation protein [Lactarius indigo]|nr:Rho GTPase activation protein [Lactarius indigo]
MPFISTEPQSREALESQSKSLLSLFDSHLKIIADRYLAFFQKRRRIEEEYINSLRTLHREANVVDSSFDPRAELTATRAAWDLLRDSLERESFGVKGLFRNRRELDRVESEESEKLFASSISFDPPGPKIWRTGTIVLKTLFLGTTVKGVLAKYLDDMIGNSNLVFGVPLVDPTANQEYVPKVIGMCISEVEKRGLDTHKIYSLRRRMEGEFTFSFISSDSIHSVAMLLKLYLWDLPVPLLRLSLRDFRQYGQNKAKYTENNFSLLRSVIRELPPVHRETLRELSRHLALVASHSEQNGMTVKALASQFCYAVFRGNTIVEGYVYLKDSLMEDLIQNADTLFDEPPSPHPPPPTRAGSGTSTISYSSLFANSMFAVPQVFDPEGPASARSSSTIFPLISSMDFPTPPSMSSDLFLSPQNSHSLYDERPPSSPPVYSPYEAETASEGGDTILQHSSGHDLATSIQRDSSSWSQPSRMGPPNTRSSSLPIDRALPTVPNVPIIPTAPIPIVPTVRTAPAVRILPTPPSSSPRPLALSLNISPPIGD